jgi:hypothetical protein
MYIARVEFYSLEVGHVGELTGERLNYAHRTLKAAKRRLGSLIAGKLHKETRRANRGAHYHIITPKGRRLTWTDARNLIEDGAL